MSVRFVHRLWVQNVCRGMYTTTFALSKTLDFLGEPTCWRNHNIY